MAQGKRKNATQSDITDIADIPGKGDTPDITDTADIAGTPGRVPAEAAAGDGRLNTGSIGNTGNTAESFDAGRVPAKAAAKRAALLDIPHFLKPQRRGSPKNRAFAPLRK